MCKQKNCDSQGDDNRYHFKNYHEFDIQHCEVNANLLADFMEEGG